MKHLCVFGWVGAGGEALLWIPWEGDQEVPPEVALESLAVEVLVFGGRLLSKLEGWQGK